MQPQPAQASENGHCFRFALHQGAFGQFQLQPLGGETRVIEDLQDGRGQVVMMELMSRQVDRQG